MKAFVLAAGEGIRLRPLTQEIPKSMLAIRGRPLMEHILALLRRHGVTWVAINLHHQPETILDHFGEGSRFGLKICYSWEDSLLGSAGGVKKMEAFLDETFFVVYGDLLTNLNLSRMLQFHREKRAALTMALYRVEEPSRCGIVLLDGEGRIERFVEKPRPEEVFSDLANTGIYVVEPYVLRYIPPNTFFDFGCDLFPLLLREGLPFYGHITQDYVVDIGAPERYLRAAEDAAAGLLDLD